MQLTRISPKHQSTIPKEIFEKLRLESGDFLEVEATESGMPLISKKLVSKDQAWFWSKEWQEKEREADQAIEQGYLSKPFQKAEELLKHLNNSPASLPKY